MEGTLADAEGDVWSKWVLRQRHGGDPQYLAELRPSLEKFRDRVLDGAELRPGMRFADIGCGDGLVGFGALARMRNALEVTFVDISPALIRHTEAVARESGVSDRCRFITASAETLDAIPSDSFDVIAARAVLAYLPDKPAVLREFLRVLKPGGRISLCDPILQDNALALCAIAKRLTEGGFGEMTRRFELLHHWGARYLPDSIEAVRSNPLTNFTERDLFRMCEFAGFCDVHVQLELDSVSRRVASWPTMLSTAAFPGTPTLGEILASLAEEERGEFQRFIADLCKTGFMLGEQSIAYATALKPVQPLGAASEEPRRQ